MDDLDPLLTNKQTAKILGLEPATLATWRCLRTRQQPPYVKVNRSVRYRLSDVMRFIESNTVTVSN